MAAGGGETRARPAVEALPAAALCLLVALVPLAFAAVLEEPFLAAKEVLVAAGAGAVAALWLLRGQPGLVLSPVWMALGWLAVAGAVSAALSSRPAVSLEAGWGLFPYFLLFVVALGLLRSASGRTMLAHALVAAGTIEAVYVLVQYTLGDPLFDASRLPGKWRTFGTLGNPNWTGEFLAAAALVSLGRLAELGTARARRWVLPAVALMVLALAATLARGAWLACAVGVAAYFWIRRPAGRLRLSHWAPAVALAAAALIILPLVYRPAAVEHLLNIKSVRGRVFIWAVTGTMIQAAPWFGHGLGTFGLHFPHYQARAFAQDWAAPFLSNASATTHAHNDYLQAWAETGLLGLAGLGVLVWMVIRRGRALAGDPLALGCWAALISLLVNAAVAFPLHLPASLMLFAVLLGAVEGAACARAVPVSLPRFAALLVAAALLLAGSLSSYQRLAADAELAGAGPPCCGVQGGK